MIIAWLAFPLVMLAACIGCGLLLETAGGWRLPGTLLPAGGLALIIVALSLTTTWTVTAEASTPLLILLSGAGWILGRRRIKALGTDPWAVLTGAVVFALFAAPLVLSGNGTFLGFYILSDSAFHLGLASLLVGHGPAVADLPQSGYTGLIYGYLTTEYPTGSDVALGALSRVISVNDAWTLQPFLATTLGMGAVALYELPGRHLEVRSIRAACAAIAGANGLLFALYSIASIKEIVTIGLLTLLAAVVVQTPYPLRLRTLIVHGVAVAATFDVLGITAVPWLGVPLAIFALSSLWRERARLRSASPRTAMADLFGQDRARTLLRTGAWTAAAVLGLAAVAYPIYVKALTFFGVVTNLLSSATDNSDQALAYLVGPLNRWQMLGIWPDYDFRFPLVQHVNVTFILIGVELLSAGLGAVWLLRRRNWGPLLLIAGNGVAAIYLLHRATPYAASKVMVIASVAIVLVATLGAAALHEAGRRLEAWLLLAAIAVGVLWTDGLTARYDSIAPAGRLHELAAIDARFKPAGPTLYPYGAEYTALYLLKDLQPIDGQITGMRPRRGYAYTAFQLTNLRWDTNDLAPRFVQSFRYVVADASPAFARPPADFELVERGRYYDVWRRTATPRVLANVGFSHYPLNQGVPSCRRVLATARTAIADHARLAYVRGTPTATLVPAAVAHPGNWVPVSGDPDELIPRQGPGRLLHPVTIPRTGVYQVWFDGSFGQRVTVSVDGRQIGSIQDQLGPLQQATRVTSVHLTAGFHVVAIDRPPAGSLTTGQDDPNPNNRVIGPLMFVDGEPADTVSMLDPRRARSLCGMSLEWLEVVRP